MLKARGYVDGKSMVMLGLCREELERLQSGHLVRIDTEKLGLEDGPTIVLVFGETHKDAEARLTKSFGPPGPPLPTEKPTRH
jgi:hypothetical protein